MSILQNKYNDTIIGKWVNSKKSEESEKSHSIV